MELTVMERMGILSLLGPEGSLLYLKAKREIVGKVGLSADEIKEFGVIEKDGQIKWRLDRPQKKEISLSGGEAVIIAEALKKLEEDKKLHENQLTLYEKFVEN